MYNIKELHPKEGVTLLAVKVPEGAYDFVYYESDCHTEFNVIEWKEPLQKIGSFVKSEGGYIIDDDFDYMILGTPDQITEEVWQTIVPGVFDFLDGFGAIMQYPDFTDDCTCYITATESGLSLLKANEVYTINPFGSHPSTWEYVTEALHMRPKDVETWEKLESNTGTWVLLQKL